ncbi:MAG: hypothetical protein ABH826_00410 [Patescibacteria group bacterium]
MTWRLLMAALAAFLFLFVSVPAMAGGGDDECTRTIAVPCPEDPTAVPAMPADAESNFDFVTKTKEELDGVAAQVDLIESLVRDLRATPTVTEDGLADELGPIRDELKRLDRELKANGLRLDAVVKAESEDREQVRLLWVSWKRVSDSLAELQETVGALDVPRFYLFLGPRLAAAYGPPIPGVTVGKRGDRTVVSQGVPALRQDFGLSLGLGWENSKSGMLLSGSVSKRNAEGVSGTASAVRYVRKDAWAIGAGLGVSGSSYELFSPGQPLPGATEMGVQLEGFFRLTLVDDGKSAVVDLHFRPSVGLFRETNPISAYPAPVGSLAVEAVVRF